MYHICNTSAVLVLCPLNPLFCDVLFVVTSVPKVPFPRDSTFSLDLFCVKRGIMFDLSSFFSTVWMKASDYRRVKILIYTLMSHPAFKQTRGFSFAGLSSHRLGKSSSDEIRNCSSLLPYLLPMRRKIESCPAEEMCIKKGKSSLFYCVNVVVALRCQVGNPVFCP